MHKVLFEPSERLWRVWGLILNKISFLLLSCCGASQVVLVVKNLTANARELRDAGSIPGLRRSPRGGSGNPLQYPCLENPIGREAWWATVHGVTKSQT